MCVRLPGKSGRRFSRVWDVPARSGAITELAEQLVELGVEKVSVESTSDYWRIWYYLLGGGGAGCAAGQRPRCQERAWSAQNRQARRSLAGQADRKGAAAALFVPPAPVRRAAGLHPAARGPDPERTRYWQRLEKLLEDAAIKVSAVASTLDTLSTRDMVEALIAGERDPHRLADFARGRMKAKRSDSDHRAGRSLR